MTRALLVVLAACNGAFGLDETDVVPEVPPPDADDDGVPDAADNCPLVENDQSDEDDDGFGDRCDNCPLVANSLQDAQGDADAIGDACDPHPNTAGDCLVMLDTLDAPDAFAAHWEVTSTGPEPAITTAAGGVVIDPGGDHVVTLFARDAAAQRFAGTYDAQLRGEYLGMQGKLFAVSNVSGSSLGYGCGVGWSLTYTAVAPWARAAAPAMYGLPLSDPPLGGDTLLRLVSATTSGRQVVCRVDYGLAFGVATPLRDPATTHPVDGAPGIVVEGAPSRVLAYALYRSQSDACAETVYR